MWVALRSLTEVSRRLVRCGPQGNFWHAFIGIDNTPAAPRAGADHMNSRKAVLNAKLVGASKVTTAWALD
jgi:hypothetical protein